MSNYFSTLTGKIKLTTEAKFQTTTEFIEVSSEYVVEKGVSILDNISTSAGIGKLSSEERLQTATDMINVSYRHALPHDFVSYRPNGMVENQTSVIDSIPVETGNYFYI